jgi:broad specificity phosphatase PhoE
MTRRRLYLMRHAAVAYFAADGRPVDPVGVKLTPEGVEQARRAAAALAGVDFDRVITSGLARTVETARIVAPGREAESWPAFEELRSGRLDDIDVDGLEAAFAGAFAGAITPDTSFLGGETIGALMERVVPALEMLVADPTWDTVLAVLHGGVNRAILSRALTATMTFFGGFEQAPACINVLDVGADGRWIVRVVNSAEHLGITEHARSTTMEEYYAEYVATRSRKPQTSSPNTSGSSSIGT